MTSEAKIDDMDSMSPSKSKTGKDNRKSLSLPPETVEYLKAWMMSPEHIAHPYPTEQEKAQIMIETGIELKQLTNWFVNNRKRYWKPRVEARIHQQAYAAASVASAHAAVLEAAVKASHVSPISPDGSIRPELNLGTPGFVRSDLPRTVSLCSLMGTDMVKILSRRDSSQSLHLVSESSSSGSVSASSESGDTTVESSDECINEQFTTTYEIGSLASFFPTSVEQTSGQHSSQVSPPSTPMKKRKFRTPVRIEDPIPGTPRKKFRRVSLETWKDACQEASHVYCASLPTLEEATQLFGYAD